MQRDSLSETSTYDCRLVDIVLEPSVTELKTDDVQKPMFVLFSVLVVFHPVFHRHLETFLRIHVHYVNDTSRSCNKQTAWFT